MTAHVIKAQPGSPGAFAGWYLKDAGMVDAHWTPEPAKAMRFASRDKAVTYWASVPPGLGAYFPVSFEEVS